MTKGTAEHNSTLVLARPCHKSPHYDMYALALYDCMSTAMDDQEQSLSNKCKCHRTCCRLILDHY